jgi:hypothetical protein
MTSGEEHEAYISSPEYTKVAKTLAFCRLWCIVELYAGLEAGVPIVFRCCNTRFHPKNKGSVTVASGEAAVNMLWNFSHMMDASKAECAEPEDRKREMGIIGEANLPKLNKAVTAALVAGGQATVVNVVEVDAFICGEPEALRRLPSGRLRGALVAAASAGQLSAVQELLDTREWELGSQRVVTLGTALGAAAVNGRLTMVQLLLARGAEVNQVSQSYGAFPLLIAAQNGHAEVVQLLLAHGADRSMSSQGFTPMRLAQQKGHAAVVSLLRRR